MKSEFSELLPAYEAIPLKPDRGGYTLTMRECDGTEQVLSALADEKYDGTDHKRLHVGWGSFRNLDIAAVRQAAAVILLDINDHQFRVWDAVQKALAGSADATDFIDVLANILPRTPPLRQFDSDTRGWLASDLIRPGSWLCESEPGRFTHIQKLFNEGRVATYCLDIRGGKNPESFLHFRNSLEVGCKFHGLETDTLYISNLPWMMEKAQGFFGEEHSDFSRTDLGNGAAALRRNLHTIAPLFNYLISAARLAPCSKPDDLRWQTECCNPEDWLNNFR